MRAVLLSLRVLESAGTLAVLLTEVAVTVGLTVMTTWIDTEAPGASVPANVQTMAVSQVRPAPGVTLLSVWVLGTVSVRVNDVTGPLPALVTVMP